MSALCTFSRIKINESHPGAGKGCATGFMAPIFNESFCGKLAGNLYIYIYIYFWGLGLLRLRLRLGLMLIGTVVHAVHGHRR